MQGYKGFDSNLCCRGKQYETGKTFEEERAEICCEGMHFCPNPLDVLDYYPLIEDGKMNRFAEVEALDEALTDDDRKYCTKRLKIGAELNLKGFIKASFNFLWGKCYEVSNSSGSQLASSGDYSQLASSGDGSHMVIEGKNSAGACLGRNSIIKGKIGTWITLASYDDEGIIDCVKSAQIDGTKLKEDVFYRLENGEFVEVEEY